MDDVELDFHQKLVEILTGTFQSVIERARLDFHAPRYETTGYPTVEGMEGWGVEYTVAPHLYLNGSVIYPEHDNFYFTTYFDGEIRYKVPCRLWEPSLIDDACKDFIDNGPHFLAKKITLFVKNLKFLPGLSELIKKNISVEQLKEILDD